MKKLMDFCIQNLVFVIRTSPLLLILFIAFGDRTLPDPWGRTSYNLRNSITNALSIEDNSDVLNNTKYNNRRGDRVVEELSK